MEYTTVFEMQTSGIGTLAFAAFGLIFVAVGAVLVRQRHALAEKRGRLFANFFSFFFLGFAILWTVFAGLGTGLKQHSLRSDYERGNFQVIEGKVENFDPMPKEGHKSESFTVNGMKFSYSDFRVTPGFNNTASHGGPIREGLWVRISHIGNTIVKLEIDASEF